MKKRARWAVSLGLLCILLPALLAQSPSFAQTAAISDATMLAVPDDLQRDGAQAQAVGEPLVLMFSLPDCPYCKVVRNNYLLPMLREADPGHQPVIRELQITSGKTLTGFDGARTTQAAVAKQYGVRMAPTLVFVDAAGQPLTDPIVGGDGHGFYAAYLDRAFAEARKSLKAAR